MSTADARTDQTCERHSPEGHNNTKGETREMTRTLKTPDAKKIVIDVAKDDCIYEDRRHNATRGTDLHAHKAQSGKTYFYFYCWSQWENEDTTVDLCTKDAAEKFLIERSTGGLISDDEIENATKHGIDLMEETG